MDNWRDYAACKGADPQVFFVERGHANDIGKAKAICATCIVRPSCLKYALSLHERDAIGIWGGTTQEERRILKRSLKAG